MKQFILKYWWLLLIGFLIIAQAFKIDKTNPPVDPQKDFLSMTSPSQEIVQKFKNTCYDCHSNTTQYPWYMDVAPISWWLKGHVRNGRKAINYSTWADFNDSDREYNVRKTIEVLDEKRMPLKSYTWMHPNAKLTEAERTLLVTWLKSKY